MSRGRIPRLAALIALLALVVGVSAMAATARGGDSGAGRALAPRIGPHRWAARRRPLNAAERRSLNHLRRLMAREKRHARAVRAHLNSPRQRARRKHSRSAFRHLSKTAAIAAASTQPTIAHALWPPPALGSGQAITRYLSTNSAMVNGPGGRGVVLSTTPLAVDDGHGHRVPIDVSLTDQGSSYRPVRAAVPISIAKTIGDGATLGSIGVTLADAAPNATPSLVGGKVYYANTSTDTDYFVAPLPDAIEAGWVLRSPAAPEDQTLSFQLPAGAHLQASDSVPDAVEIRQDGNLIATIPPPSAWDADGTPVDASYSVAGDQLRVHVAHQSADVRYPIEVDPLVGMVFGNGPNGNPGNFPGWGFNWIDAWGVPLRPGTTTVPQTADLYPGNNYAAGAEGWWQFDAAGTSYIYEWDLYRYHHVEGTGQSWAIIGIYNHGDGDKSSSTGNWYADGNQPPNGGQPEGDQGDFFGWARRICTTGYTTNGGPCPAWSNRTNNNVRLKLQLAAQICCLASDGEYTSVWGSTLLIGDNAAPPAPKMPTLPTGWVQSLTSVDVTATQPGAGVSRVNAAIPDAGSNDGKNLPCASYTAAPYNSTQGPAYSPCPENPPPQTVAITKTVPEGIHAVNANAVSATGVTGPTASQNVKIDRTPPSSPELSDSLYAQRGKVLYGGTYNLHMHATDGDPNGGNNAARSGMRNFAVEVDDATGNAVKNWTGSSQTCSAGSCDMQDNFPFHVEDYSPGVYTIKVTAFDQLSHPQSAPTFTVTVAPLLATGSADELGLEDYMQYYSTPTGAGTRAHVNLANGNLVWHAIPVVNPGRGLSTFVNLTYNSQATSLEDTTQPLLNVLLPYQQAGVGFSLGASGITRINDPLDVSAADAGKITLTDLDGTRHVFISHDQEETYTAPPGVHLRLRRFTSGMPGLYSDPQKVWAATRPDGVTFYFDAAGYETSLVDRNGNALTYSYEYYGPDAKACQAADSTALDSNTLAPVCPHRLNAITDAMGRSVTFGYDHDPQLVVSPITNKDVVDLGHVQTITDHARRTTRLDYSADGYLQGLTNAYGSSAPQVFSFGYAPSDPNCAAQPRYLNSIGDPRSNAAQGGGTTAIQYVACSSGQTTPQLVDTLQQRGNSHNTQFAFAPSGSSSCQATTCTTVTDPLGHATAYELDNRGRLTKMTDARGAETDVQWDNQSQNPCPAVYDDNQVVRITEAANDASQAATNTMCYNQNGRLTSESNPAGQATIFAYRDGAGTQVSPRGSDGNGTFVSDLVRLTTPRGTASGQSGAVTGDPSCPDPAPFSYEFCLDTNGNVVAQKDPLGYEADTAYDSYGEITSETDWHVPGQSGNTTTYSDYDNSGFPRIMVQPRGNAVSGSGDCTGQGADCGAASQNQWFFFYDDVGNLLRVTDPRGTYGTGPPENPHTAYTTTLSYDALDRLTSEQRPIDSSAGRFTTRTYGYDLNGNMTSLVDGNGKQWQRSYTPMDDLQDSLSPSVAHSDGSGTKQEDTHYSYDEDQNLTLVTSPKGTATTGDYSTSYVYDTVNEMVAAIRQSRAVGSPGQDLAESYAYDLRGNLVGVVDPSHNSQYGGQPQDNAQDPSKRRFTYQYDLANRRTAATEDPAGLNLRTQVCYDADGNVTAVIDPRGSETCGNPGSYTTQYVYDARDQLTSTIDPDGNKTETVLRPDGLASSITQPNGTGACDPAGADCSYETKFAYDPNGALTSLTLPRAPNQYGPTSQQWSFVRNQVGDPISIEDARGNSFENKFFDNGLLKSTARPSFWALGLAANGASAATSAQSSSAGGGSGPSDGPTITEPSPDQIIAGTSSASSSSSPPSAGSAGPTGAPSSGPTNGVPDGSAAGGGSFGSVAAQPQPDLLPKAGTTTFDYDGNLNLTTVGWTSDGGGAGHSDKVTFGYDATDRLTDATYPLTGSSSLHTALGYDPNGNLATLTDPAGAATTFKYDQFDRRTDIVAPGASGDTTDNAVAHSNVTTQLTYDANSNLKTVQLPNGSGSTWQYGYDAIDRLTNVTDPESNETAYCYDRADNKTFVTLPRATSSLKSSCPTPNAPPQPFQTRSSYDGANLLTSETSATDNGDQFSTNYSYDRDGNLTKVDAPGTKSSPNDSSAGSQVTDMTYDGRDLPWTTTVGSRTTATEYDGNGNLRRVVNPPGIDSSTHLPAKPDTTLQTSDPSNHGDSSIDAATKYATVYEYSPDNNLSSVLMPWGSTTLGGSTDETARYRQDFDLNPSDETVRSITAPYDWSGGANGDPHTSYSYFDTGWIQTSVDHPNASYGKQQIEYGYDKQGNQTQWCSENLGQLGCDSSSDAKRIVSRHYFLSGQLSSREAKSDPGDSSPREYTYQYDNDGNLTQYHDSQLSRSTNLTYDGADRNRLVNEAWSGGKDTHLGYDADNNVIVRETDGAWDASANQYNGGKRTTFTYDGLDREDSMLVDQDGQNKRFSQSQWWDSGQLQSRTQYNGSDANAPLRATDQYYYGPDALISEAVRKAGTSQTQTKDQSYSYDADANRTKDERGDYAFNPRDQITSWTHDGNTTAYTLDGSGAITDKTTKDQNGVTTGSTHFTYQGVGSDRLQSANVTSGGASQAYNYCYDGSEDNVSRITTQDCSAASDPNDVTYTYDDFDRLTQSKGPGEPADTTYAYDALDRRDFKCVGSSATDCAGGHRYDYSYIGLTPDLSREQDASDGQTTTRTYDYNSSYERTGLDEQAGTNPAVYHSYAKDANGSVEGLQGDNGTIAAGDSYQYDPYGDLQNGGSLSQDAIDNPFRFEDFYYDSGIKQYDMQARVYRPDIGRFLTADRFEASNGDYNLEADPLTQNRYAFAGGNPINRVEFDGHAEESFVNNADCRCSNTTGRPAHRQRIGGMPLKAPASQHLLQHRANVAQRQAAQGAAGSAPPPSGCRSDACGGGGYAARPVPRPPSVPPQQLRCAVGVSGIGCVAWSSPQNEFRNPLADTSGDLATALNLASWMVPLAVPVLGEEADAARATVEGGAELASTTPNAAKAGEDTAQAAKEGDTEIVNRSMSEAELKATQESGLVRGGREGEHFVTNDVYQTAEEAQANLALPDLPDLVAELEVPRGVFSEPRPVEPMSPYPGGGTERMATGRVPARVVRYRYYRGQR